jgi:nucleotide-binding universal stress UspA family protein
MDSMIANNRNILIAVDESENAARAVSYVMDFLTGLSGFHISLITIIAEPSEDYFLSESERTAWIADKNTSASGILEGYQRMFIEAGFRDEDVTAYAVMKECTSIGECILHEKEKLDCGTVVIGRRGISKKEEFIYGSTSNKILHTARDCAVWVIE